MKEILLLLIGAVIGGCVMTIVLGLIVMGRESTPAEMDVQDWPRPETGEEDEL